MIFDDFIELQRGFDLPEKNRQPGEYPVISANGITGSNSSYRVNAPGVVTGRSGTIGKVLFSEQAFWPLNTTLFVKDFKGNHPKYVYYYLQTLNLNRFATGAVVPTLNRNHLKPLKISVCDYETQLRITNILGSLDKKIEINQKKIAELEELAKLIYDYWFVQFDFPDEDGKPYKSSGGKMVFNNLFKHNIPKNWNCKYSKEICCFKNGINYDKDEMGNKSYRIVNVRNITSSSLFININDLDEIVLNDNNADNYIVSENCIMIARSGTPGAVRIVNSEYNSNIIYCGFIIKMEPNLSEYRNYLTYYFKLYEGTSATKTGGSILQNVSQDTLKSIVIVEPPKGIIGQFNSIIDPIHQKIISLEEEKTRLCGIRDWLLPMLMNGQVEVTE